MRSKQPIVAVLAEGFGVLLAVGGIGAAALPPSPGSMTNGPAWIVAGLLLVVIGLLVTIASRLDR